MSQTVLWWWSVLMFTAVFVSLVSANCTDDQIQTYFTSSKRPWNNYHRISQAVFPPSQLPSLLIKIRVKFVNESSASNSTDVCDEDPNETDKIYMWSMACLYVSPGMISMFSMRVLSLWTIFPNRRQADLCVKLPLLCQCDLQKQEKMKYFLSKLQSMAIRPTAPDPSKNTVKCITGDRWRASQEEKALNSVCWCILVIALLMSIVASRMLRIELKEYLNESQDQAHKSKAVAILSLLLLIFVLGFILLIVALAHFDQDWYLVGFSVVFVGLFGWRLVRFGKVYSSLQQCSIEFIYYAVVYPSLFIAFHHLLWIILGIITEPFWALPVSVAISSVLFLLYFLIYLYHKVLSCNIRRELFLLVLLFVAFLLLIYVVLLVGQTVFSEDWIASVVLSIFISVVSIWFKYVGSQDLVVENPDHVHVDSEIVPTSPTEEQGNSMVEEEGSPRT